ncbi:hypothetical protein LOK49_LG09G01837 [Camellia lanceoleosa]|uniref:Uncharacterized protein n=1 Tax=Camellia lanceoleosa TaxID=1840588 RepID=A0ACC0GLM2_9ERIC|nr:hypothetical protein LOK49_LG09G01837 [Camellia lanceoleosa]
MFQGYYSNEWTDTSVVLFDRPLGEILSTLNGHSKKVITVKFVAEGDLVVTGSTDKVYMSWYVLGVLGRVLSSFINLAV